MITAVILAACIGGIQDVPEDALKGIWLDGGGRVYVFYTPTSARFVYDGKFGIISSIRPIPNGTWTAPWLASYYWPLKYTGTSTDVNSDEWMIHEMGSAEISPRSTIGKAKGTVLGEWRIDWWKAPSKTNYPAGFDLAMHTQQGVARDRAEYVGGMKRIEFIGNYTGTNITLSLTAPEKAPPGIAINRQSGEPLTGWLTLFSRKYFVEGSYIGPTALMRVHELEYGKPIGTMLAEWNPTRERTLEIKEGKAGPADRLLFAVSIPKVKTEVTYTLSLSK